MTRNAALVQKKIKAGTPWACMLLPVICFALLLFKVQAVSASMQRGLAVCVGSLIPSLFPFLVLSRIALTGGIAHMIPSFFTRPAERLLRLSPMGSCTCLVGWVCGFPTGAVCVSSAVEKGEMSPREGERVLVLSSVPSLSFLASAVGGGMWNSTGFGLWLWGASIVSAVVVCLLLYRPGKEEKPLPDGNAASAPPISARLFTDAMGDSAWNMLQICAYVVFFFVLSGVGADLLEGLGAPPFCTPLLSGFLELSGGVHAAADLSNPTPGVLLTGFFVGWSGLSVHFQTLSVASPCPLRMGRYLLAKLLQGGLCMLLCGIWSMM